jgi:hypothetical protein
LHNAYAAGAIDVAAGKQAMAKSHSGAVRAFASVMVRDIRAHRLTAPSTRTCGEAGMLAGLLARLSGPKVSQDLLNDALLFLQARATGCAMLTANISDFDLFEQLLAGSTPLLYRAV